MLIEKVNAKSIKKAIELLQNGGVVVFPTETSYGIGCDFKNKRAISRIFKIKNRTKGKGFPVICSSKKQVSEFFDFSGLAQKLAKKHWPGAWSIIMKSYNHKIKKSEEVPVRVSSNKVAVSLARGLGRPITATSANIAGSEPLYNVGKIVESFAGKKNKPDLILDGGTLSRKKASKIVKIENGEVIVLRR